MNDLELRNRFRQRVYGITVLRNLFGEPELWIQWGPERDRARIRQRVEVFTDFGALLVRRRLLIMRRSRRGYHVVGDSLAADVARIRVPPHRACFANGCTIRLRGGRTLCAKHRRAATEAP